MKTRWICIGMLRLGGIIIAYNGSWQRCAASLNWRGRTAWCQPWQFPDWAGLQWAVERRLSFAGLQPVAYASRWPGAGEHRALWVQVMRCSKRNFPRNMPGECLSSGELNPVVPGHEQQKNE
jgi:hypothetical protein